MEDYNENSENYTEIDITTLKSETISVRGLTRAVE